MRASIKWPKTGNNIQVQKHEFLLGLLVFESLRKAVENCVHQPTELLKNAHSESMVLQEATLNCINSLFINVVDFVDWNSWRNAESWMKSEWSSNRRSGRGRRRSSIWFLTKPAKPDLNSRSLSSNANCERMHLASLYVCYVFLKNEINASSLSWIIVNWVL